MVGDYGLILLAPAFKRVKKLPSVSSEATRKNRQI